MPAMKFQRHSIGVSGNSAPQYIEYGGEVDALNLHCRANIVGISQFLFGPKQFPSQKTRRSGASPIPLRDGIIRTRAAISPPLLLTLSIELAVNRNLRCDLSFVG